MKQLSHSELSALADAYGDAFYVASVPRYRRNIREFLSYLRTNYPRAQLGHSYKTNYLPKFCIASYEEGAYAEVVSRMEYELALRLGAEPSRIILNGPVKDLSLLEEAMCAGALLNADSVQEVQQVVAIARRFPGSSFQVGLRLNFGVGQLARSRFGIDVDGPDLPYVLQLIAAEPNCRLRGLHCHFGGDRMAESYAARTRRMVELAASIFPAAPPDYVDIGGGFAGKMAPEMAVQLGYAVPSVQQYAESVGREFARVFGAANGPELIVEPGMGVLADTLEFACQVAVTKRVVDAHHAITTGSIYNIKPTLNKVELPVRVVRANPDSGAKEDWCISGYTCMEIDVMRRSYVGALDPGDFLVFGNVGAYTVVLKPPFIKPAPAILSFGSDGEIEVARRAETLDDILATYRW